MGDARPSGAIAAASDAMAEALSAAGIAPGTYDSKPLSMVRKTIARRLTASFRDVPQFALQMEVPVDQLLAARRVHNAGDGAGLSINDLIIKAAAITLQHCPDVNASFTDHGIAYHHHADISVAVAIEDGLITPIIRAAESKSLACISSEMKDLAARARIKRLQPSEYYGGTFSISNLGMFGITSFGSIVSPPQACILSVGALVTRLCLVDGAAAEETVMTFTLTCDHRVVDGATGARWLQTFRDILQSPEEWLA